MVAYVPTILQVLPALSGGGVERGAIDIALAVKIAGWNSIVASSGGKMTKELDRAGVEHVAMPLATKKPWIMHRNANSLASLIFDRKIDIVHARSRAPAWSAYYATNRMGAHYITTFHGTYNLQNFLKKTYNSIMIRGEPVIAISNFISNHISTRYSVPLSRIVTISRGVDLNYFNPANVSAQRIIQLSNSWRLPDGVPVIMLPGRLTRWKGHKLLIDALANLRRQDLRCLFVGESQVSATYKLELENLIKEKNLENIFHFVGHCLDMPAAYMLADIVVSASTDPEAFGRIAIEAQAMGRVILASNHGGSSETVLHGQTGWLFENEDMVSLTVALERALALDSNNREKVAVQSRAHICAHYDLRDMQQSTLRVYEKVLSKEGK